MNFRIALLLLPALALQLPVQSADLTRHPVLSKAEIQPVHLDRTETLNDPSAAKQVDLVIVFSEPRPRSGSGGRGLLDGVAAASDTNSASSWIQQQEQELRNRGTAKYRELTGQTNATPQISVRYNNAGRGLDYGADLAHDGYQRHLYRQTVAEGRTIWAAIFSKESRPASARLGEVRRRITLRFRPRISENQLIRPEAAPEVSVEPQSPPAGVAADAWNREIARVRRLGELQARALVLKLNRLAFRTPDAALDALAQNRPFTFTQPVSFMTSAPLQIRVEGTVRREVDAPLGEPATRQTGRVFPWSGSWEVAIDGMSRGRVFGYAWTGTNGAAGLSVLTGGKEEAAIGDLAQNRGEWVFWVNENIQEIRKITFAGEGNVPSATWENRDGSRRGAVRFRRLRPQVQNVQVTPLAAGALDLTKMQRTWEVANAPGNLPRIRITFTGSGLFRPIAESGTNEFFWLWRGFSPGSIRFEDSNLLLHTTYANRDGTKFYTELWLARDTLPGRKIVHLEGTPVPFDLVFTNAPSATNTLEEFRFSTREQPEAPAQAVRQDEEILLLARFSAPSGDDMKPVEVWIERNGQKVFRVESIQRLLRTDDPEVYSIDPVLVSSLSAASGTNAAFRVERGDVLGARLGSETTKVPISPGRRADRPLIRFRPDPTGYNFLDGGRFEGDKLIADLPILQPFWVEAAYIKPQEEPFKMVKLSWADRSMDVRVDQVANRRDVYRGGPFYIQPPPVQPSTPPDSVQP